MKRFLTILITLTQFVFGADAFAETVKVKTIRESSFLLTPYMTPFKPEGMMPGNIYTIPKGTEVQLIQYNPFTLGELLIVSLEDGSRGFMPIMSFCDATATISGKNRAKVPEGKYSVKASGVWRYYQQADKKEYHSAPEYTTLISAKGKRYDFSYQKCFGAKDNYHKWKFSPLNDFYDYGSFNNVLESIRSFEEINDYRVRYEPEKHELQEYVGFSRSFIEYVFGEPFSVAGPQVENNKGYSRVLYWSVMWKADKKHMNRGVSVYYNKDNIAEEVAQSPFAWTLSEYKASAIRLYFPHSKASENGSPKIIDKLRIGSMYFIENKLHVNNDFAILGILLLLAAVWGVIVALWIRYVLNYGSNGWATTRYVLLTIPAFLFCMIYAGRYPLIIMIIFALFLVFVYMIPAIILDKKIQDNRCPHCHKFIKPIILESIPGVIRGGDLIYSGMTDHLDHSISTSSGTTVTVDIYRHETTMPLTQDMEYKVRCPLCSHRWMQKRVEDRPSIRGPIVVECVEVTRKDWVRTEVEEKEIRDELTDQLIDRVVKTKTESDSSSNKYTRSVDDGYRYKPYFDAYLKGDTGAIDRYYNDCWGSASYDLVNRNIGKKN